MTVTFVEPVETMNVSRPESQQNVKCLCIRPPLRALRMVVTVVLALHGQGQPECEG